MLNLGVRAHDYGEKGDLGEVAKVISQKGFSSVQLALAKSLGGFETKLGQITPGFASNTKKILDAKDIRIAVLGCYIKLAHENRENREFNLAYFKEHLRYAKEFGASLVGTETFCLNGTSSPTEKDRTEEAFDQVVRSVAELVEEAERLGVLVGVEGVARHIINTPEKMKRLIDTVKSNNLQVIFDPVNLLDEDNHTKQEEIVKKSFDLFGDRIAVIHSKDYIIEEGKMKTVYTGKGLFDYKPLMEILKKNKPGIDILLENSVPEKVHESVKLLEEIYKNS